MSLCRKVLFAVAMCELFLMLSPVAEHGEGSGTGEGCYAAAVARGEYGGSLVGVGQRLRGEDAKEFGSWD
jgi:hypothetical protein